MFYTLINSIVNKVNSIIDLCTKFIRINLIIALNSTKIKVKLYTSDIYHNVLSYYDLYLIIEYVK